MTAISPAGLQHEIPSPEQPTLDTLPQPPATYARLSFALREVATIQLVMTTAVGFNFLNVHRGRGTCDPKAGSRATVHGFQRRSTGGAWRDPLSAPAGRHSDGSVSALDVGILVLKPKGYRLPGNTNAPRQLRARPSPGFEKRRYRTRISSQMRLRRVKGQGSDRRLLAERSELERTGAPLPPGAAERAPAREPPPPGRRGAGGTTGLCRHRRLPRASQHLPPPRRPHFAPPLGGTASWFLRGEGTRPVGTPDPSSHGRRLEYRHRHRPWQ
jgi:hypothetical protein